MFITLLVPTAIASPKSIEQKVTLYYPNGNWEFTPVETVFMASDVNNLYLDALQQLTDPESLPTGCYDEFPETFKVQDFSVDGKIAYVTISDAAFDDKELSDSWLNTLGDIISYNLFKMNEKIESVEFLSSTSAKRDMNSVQKSNLFAVPAPGQAKDLPTLELDIDVLKQLPKDERNKMIQEAINKALGTEATSNTVTSAAVYTVCIDPGHGGTDPGTSNMGVYEKNVNLNIALAARDYLEGVSWPTFDVLMTRETDVSRALSYRHDLANNNNVDIFISIHCDWNDDSSKRGAYGFYPNNHDVTDSKSLANAIIRGVVDFSSMPKFGDARYEDLQVLRNTTMPATLTECGFMSNGSDLSILVTEDDDIGYGIGVNANFWCQVNI